MSIYTEEWSKRMHEALEDVELQAANLKSLRRIMNALICAKIDIRSEEAFRTVVEALANELLDLIDDVDEIEKAVNRGLQVPEAEQAEEE